MDGHRIDRYARWLGRGMTRRRAVSGAAGAVVTLVTSGAVRAQEATPAVTGPVSGPVTLAACLGFTATIVTGPNAGASWTGDLMMEVQADGYFTALLVPPGAADHETLLITDVSQVIAQATGQINGASVDWFLYVGDGRTVFGHGMLEVVSGELRGMVSGWEPGDVGVFHGSGRPPFIRQLPSERYCCQLQCTKDLEELPAACALSSAPSSRSSATVDRSPTGEERAAQDRPRA